MNEPVIAATADKDQPLREDIRLLGRLLGDTLRDVLDPRLRNV